MTLVAMQAKPSALLKDDPQLFTQFFENESFRRFVTDRVRDLNRAA
jgi:hypothetical protein